MHHFSKSSDLFALRRKLLLGGTTVLGAMAVMGSKVLSQPATPPESAAIAQTTANPTSQPTGRLTGKVALITGAARGIGRACAVYCDRI